MLSQTHPIRPVEVTDVHAAVTASTAAPATNRAELAHAMRMMGVYLEAAQRERNQASSTAQLTAVIQACVESLAADRRYDDPRQGSRQPLDALGLAMRYVDEHLDANGKWCDTGAGPDGQTLAFRRRSGVFMRMRSGLRRAVNLIRAGT